MEINTTKPVSGNFERKTLVFLSAIFVCVLISAWIYSKNLRQTISASNAVVNIDVRAPVEVEKLRNLAESTDAPPPKGAFTDPPLGYYRKPFRP